MGCEEIIETFEGDRTHEKILADVCECSEDHYCFLKAFIKDILHTDDRTLEQLKCIEIFKYERSEKECIDIGWEKAGRLWINEGYAQKFRSVYRDGMKHEELYDLVVRKSGVLCES